VSGTIDAPGIPYGLMADPVLSLVREVPMPVPSLEQQACQKARIAARMLADARRLYEESGRTYGGPGLDAEVLAQLVEELTHRIAEADRLNPFCA
jgi:hypothetical protein